MLKMTTSVGDPQIGAKAVRTINQSLGKRKSCWFSTSARGLNKPPRGVSNLSKGDLCGEKEITVHYDPQQPQRTNYQLKTRTALSPPHKDENSEPLEFVLRLDAGQNSNERSNVQEINHSIHINICFGLKPI